MLLLQCFCIIFQRISKKAFWFWHNYIQYIHNSGINIDNNLFSCFMWRHLQAFSTAKLHAATHILHVPLQTTSQGSEPIQAFTRSISDYYYSLCMQNRNRCTCINVHVLHQHCPLSCTFTKWKPYSKSICLLTEKKKKKSILHTTSQITINPPAELLAGSISKVLDPWVIQCRKILSFRSSVLLLLDDIKIYYKQNKFTKILIITLQIPYFTFFWPQKVYSN